MRDPLYDACRAPNVFDERAAMTDLLQQRSFLHRADWTLTSSTIVDHTEWIVFGPLHSGPPLWFKNPEAAHKALAWRRARAKPPRAWRVYAWRLARLYGWAFWGRRKGRKFPWN